MIDITRSRLIYFDKTLKEYTIILFFFSLLTYKLDSSSSFIIYHLSISIAKKNDLKTN